MVFANPSNTANADTTKRTWNKNTYAKGLSFNNYFNTSAITACTFNGNVMSLTSQNSGYGVGFVLSDDAHANETYQITFSKTGMVSSTVTILNYKSDGTVMNGLDVASGGTFTIPSDAAYTLIVVMIGGGTGSGTFTLTDLGRIA